MPLFLGMEISLGEIVISVLSIVTAVLVIVVCSS